jgi:hypothetical protein
LPLGDGVLLIELGADASEATRRGCGGRAPMRHPPAGVRDVVAAVCTVALHYDPLALEPIPETAATPYHTHWRSR